MRICLVRLSALGDVVMMIPLVRTLRKNFPDAEITWVIDRCFLEIVEHLEGVSFLPVKKIRNPIDYFKMKKLLGFYSFDLLLATQASFAAHLFYTLIQAKRKLGYDAIRGKDFHSLFVNETIEYAKEHTVDGFLRFATAMGAKEKVLDGSVPLTNADRKWVTDHLPQSGYFVINPYSTLLEIGR
jgi:heptosyltransferase I